MAQTNSRLEQFQKMANDDPTNEVAHFSLGREYLAAGRHSEALASLTRCLELNPNIAKAYQLSAQAQIAVETGVRRQRQTILKIH